MIGSPPRVRGKLLMRGSRPCECRITPACAGKTLSMSSRILRRKDHPRVCGENRRNRHCAGAWIGSPPRVRGKLTFYEYSLFLPRITPACAGKTAVCAFLRWGRQDHPRVCGENYRLYNTSICSGGSPPRVRGKPVWPDALILHGRITPACAGKTLLLTRY